MTTFEQLAGSRREWIDNVLKPWCRQADRRELIKAEVEWENIAGRVDAEATLWTWAWSRFPELVHDGMAGVNETREVRVETKDGAVASGFPDGRRSERGKLTLATSGGTGDLGPFSMDDIARIDPA